MAGDVASLSWYANKRKKKKRKQKKKKKEEVKVKVKVKGEGEGEDDDKRAVPSGSDIGLKVDSRPTRATSTVLLTVHVPCCAWHTS